MARAISSLPTPDWPSISTGIAERGGLLGGAQHGLHARAAGDDVLEGERAGAAALDAVELAFERARRERVAQRHLQPLGADRLDHEIGRARAHGADHVVDAAMRGLHDHRDGEPGLAHLGEHAEPVEIGHHEVEHDRVDARAVRAGEQRDRGVAALGDDGLVAGARDHVFQEPALHRVVVDDQNTLGHARTPADGYLAIVPNWGTVAEDA